MAQGFINHFVIEWNSAGVRVDVAKRFMNLRVTEWSTAGVRNGVHTV
jgi:hypothetical protein